MGRTTAASAATAGGVDEETDHGRPVAPGGWRRIVVGLLLGILIGALIGLVLPRDDGPRRSRSSFPRTDVGPDPVPSPTAPSGDRAVARLDTNVGDDEP